MIWAIKVHQLEIHHSCIRRVAPSLQPFLASHCVSPPLSWCLYHGLVHRPGWMWLPAVMLSILLFHSKALCKDDDYKNGIFEYLRHHNKPMLFPRLWQQGVLPYWESLSLLGGLFCRTVFFGGIGSIVLPISYGRTRVLVVCRRGGLYREENQECATCTRLCDLDTGFNPCKKMLFKQLDHL